MSTNSKQVFVHSHALCETNSIGDRTKVWAFSHILSGAIIGSDCNICDHVFIENDVQMGDRVTVKCGVQLWDGLRIEDDVFIGPNATFTNDKFPRSKQWPETFLQTRIEQGASIGANATVLPGITIGRYAMIAAGAVVTGNVAPFSIVAGVPARVVGYVGDSKTEPNGGNATERVAAEESPRGVRLTQFRQYSDPRGKLVVAEHASELPFVPQRSFLVYGVPNLKVRGEHAHRKCHELLIAVNGNVHVTVDDGSHRRTYLLDHPSKGLLVPAGVWASQHHFSADAALFVFASLPFDEGDYIRDYSSYLREFGAATSGV